MHPRNRYLKNPTDFGALAEFRPSLKPYLIKKERRKKPGTHEKAPPTDIGTPDAPPTDTLTPTPDAPPTDTPPTGPCDDTKTISTVTSDAPPTSDAIPTAPPTIVWAWPASPNSSLGHAQTTPTNAPPTGPSDIGVRTARFPYTLDFSNLDGLRELTCAVLAKDFDLRVEIPVGTLIPTVPQKLNYIHWVEDLLVVASDGGGVAGDGGGVARKEQIPRGKDVIGIDIGTGMTCIYPLLGARINEWRFVATDISEEAVDCAVKNVTSNSLQDHIEVKLVSESDMLKEVVDPNVSCYAFSMCNPPFFKSKEDKLGSPSDATRPPPATVNSGTESETVVKGGEVQFVKRMIEDSLELRDRVKWYTSMVGKKSSLKELQTQLKNHQVPVITTTEFIQGKTWRWGLAWSFDETLKDKVEKLKWHRKSWPQRYSFHVVGKDECPPSPSLAGVHEVRKWLMDEWSLLEINATCEESHDPFPESHDRAGAVTMKCVAERVSWNNQRKIRRLKARLPHKNYLTPGTEAAWAALEEEKVKIGAEIDALCTPCKMEFVARIKLQGPDVRRGKKGRGGKNWRGRGRGRRGRGGKFGMAERNGAVEGKAVEEVKMAEKAAEGEEVDVEMSTDEDGGDKGKDAEELASSKTMTGEGEERKGGEGEGEQNRKRRIEMAEGEEDVVSGSAKRKRVSEGDGMVEGEGPEGEFGAKESKDLSDWLWQQKEAGKEREKVCVELEWKSGDQGNLLHQLLQYLQNRMTAIDFQQ